VPECDVVPVLRQPLTAEAAVDLAAMLKANSGAARQEGRGSWVYYRVIPEALHKLSLVLGVGTLTGNR
jgi:hypothetical protein